MYRKFFFLFPKKRWISLDPQPVKETLYARFRQPVYEPCCGSDRRHAPFYTTHVEFMHYTYLLTRVFKLKKKA